MKNHASYGWVLLGAILWAGQGAARDYELRVPDYRAHHGEVLQVPVSLNDARGLAVIRFQINYDPAVLTLQGLSAGPLGAQFEISTETEEGTVTVDGVRASALEEGAGRLALLEFLVNPGASTELYSDLAIVRFEVGDQSGVRDLAEANTLIPVSGSVRVSLERDLDNERNGLPDWWERQHGLDLFSAPEVIDSDGDLLSDLLEYGFGGHPRIPDELQARPFHAVADIGGERFLTLTFRRLREVATLRYTLQESDTMDAWESVEPDARLVGPPVDLGNGLESVTVRSGLPMTGPLAPPRGFMMIGVEKVD